MYLDQNLQHSPFYSRFAAEEFLYQDHLGRICLLNAANRTERVLMSNVTFVSTFLSLALALAMACSVCLLLIWELNKYLQHVIYDWGWVGRGSGYCYLKCTHLTWQPNSWQALLTDTHTNTSPHRETIASAAK